MATIHTYKQAKINNIGMWIQSVDGGPEIYLDARQAMQLGESIAKQQRGTRSAAPARRSASTGQRFTTTTQRSAPTITQVAAKQFVGKSSCTNPQFLDHAKNLAKQRATKEAELHLRSLRAKGKSLPSNATGRHTVDAKGNVAYTITLA